MVRILTGVSVVESSIGFRLIGAFQGVEFWTCGANGGLATCFLKMDVEHLDRRIPLVDETAQHGRFGRQRWAVNKRILCYLRFLTNWIENKVETAGAREEAIQLCLVNWMFEAGSQIILQAERDCQKSFLTVVHAVFTRG